jgi:hypothetical protein
MGIRSAQQYLDEATGTRLAAQHARSEHHFATMLELSNQYRILADQAEAIEKTRKAIARVRRDYRG